MEAVEEQAGGAGAGSVVGGLEAGSAGAEEGGGSGSLL